jgi:hypothetical protein
MESYHVSNSLSSGGYSDSDVREPRSAPRRLGPFEYIATPPIQHLLDAIVRHCRVGGSFAPGVRVLAEMSGVTLSLISGLLYELDNKGWIRYDGRVIMVLRDPSAGDQENGSHLIAPENTIDDQNPDRPFEASGSLDQNQDQFEGDMVLTAANRFLDSESAATKNLPCAAEIDPPPDHRALLLAELGAGAAIIRDALRARPGLTPEEIRDSWAHFEARIAEGRCKAGAFFDAIRRGQLHSAPPDPTRPLRPEDYAGDSLFRLGSDTTGFDAPAQTSPPASAPPPDVGPPARSLRDRALDLLGDWTAENHSAMVRDSMFLQSRLGMGDSDAEALAALEQYRKRVKR